MTTYVDVDKTRTTEGPKLLGKRAECFIRCPCGLDVSLDLSTGPRRVLLECPNLECRRVYQFEYSGRRRALRIAQ